MKLSILYESPFWIALIEEEREGLLYVGRHVFGSEPSSQDVYQFILSVEYYRLLDKMTVGLPVEINTKKRINPKRLQRQIKRERERVGITNKSHEAMRLQQEANKQESKANQRSERIAKRDRQRQLAIQKKKQKKRGK